MQGMREVLRGSLARTLDGISELDRLAAAWTIACGPAMAGRGTVSGYAQGVVQVEVSDAVWLRQMCSLEQTLRRELARVSGVEVKAIDFQLKRDRKQRDEWRNTPKEQ